MLFLFGLGNPGWRYKYTLHNLGFWTVDEFASKYRVNFSKKFCKSRLGYFNFRRSDFNFLGVYLIKPYTYMNLSGEAVSCLKTRFKFHTRQMLIICDDLNLEKGYIRIKPRGGSGGHKGLASIMNALGTDEFPRLRIGIGPLEDKDRAEEYLTRKLQKEEIRYCQDIVKKVVQVIEFFMEEGIAKTMSFYNRKKII